MSLPPRGSGRVQQATALANAFAESGLDPRQRTTSSREDSVGLFQLNRKGGEGEGHTVEELMDPDANIAITISKIINITAFNRAASPLSRDAVDAFVRLFERPQDIPGEIAACLALAQRLLA